MKTARTTPATTYPSTISAAESGEMSNSWIEFMKRPWNTDDELSL